MAGAERLLTVHENAVGKDRDIGGCAEIAVRVVCDLGRPRIGDELAKLPVGDLARFPD